VINLVFLELGQKASAKEKCSASNKDDNKKATYNRVILNPIGLAPGRHYPNIIGGNDDDLIHPLSLEVLEMANIAA